MEEEEEEDVSNDIEFDYNDDNTFFAHDTFWKYPNSESIYMDYRDSKPLCLVLNGDTFGGMIRTGQVVKLLLDDTFIVVEIRSMHYHFWKPEIDMNSQVNRGYVLLDGSQFPVLFSCVLLPLKLSDDKCIYSAVRDDYTIMDGSGAFV
jgi:hypothetical protein